MYFVLSQMIFMKLSPFFTREGEMYLVTEQTESIVRDAGESVAGKNTMARNAKDVGKFKVKVSFGRENMETLMTNYIDRKVSLKYR